MCVHLNFVLRATVNTANGSTVVTDSVSVQIPVALM